MALPSLKGLGMQTPIFSPLGNFEVGKTAQSTPQTTNVNIDPLQIAIDIIHGTARSGGAVGLQLAGTPELPLPPEGTFENKVQKIIFGPETIKSLATRIAEGEQTAQKLGIPTKGPLGINPALLSSVLVVGGMVALDFSGVGGEVGLGDKLLKETTTEGASKLLSKIGVSEELLPKFSKLFAEAKTPEEISSHLQSLVQEVKSVIPPNLQPLAQEARKYKSAEEFVNSKIGKKQPVYHGTTEVIEGDFKYPLYLTKDKAYAEHYATNKSASSITTYAKKGGGEKVYEFYPKDSKRVLDIRKPEHAQAIENYWRESVSGQQVPTKTGLPDWIEGESLAQFIEENKLPFDSILVDEGGIVDFFTQKIKHRGIGFVAINKNALLTKSQLTDFYNQAKGISESTSKEAGMATKGIEQATLKESAKAGQLLPEHITPPTSEISSLTPSVAPIGQEVKGAIDRLTEAISTAKPARGALEKAFTAERAKRTGAVAGIFEQAQGQKGYFQALGKLKGALTPAEKKSFELGGNLIEKDINSLFKAAQINPSLDVYEKLNTQTALTKILAGTIPTNNELSLLEKTYGSKMVEAVLSQRTTGQKVLEGLKQFANLPRSIMSSFDMSAPFRQGLLLISHPKAFGSSFLTMFRQFGSEEAFKAVQEGIAKMPEYALMKEGKLALTDVGILMTNREEKFMSSWAEKIPIIKYPIRASSRAYVGFLNKLRADVFTDIVKGARAGGRELDEKLVKGIADFVNTASGRGSKLFGVPIGNSGQILNGIFFSPRLMASRLTMLNPVEYVVADPIIRKEMFKSLFTVLGSGLTVLGLAKMAGAKVGDNSNSSDFGKIIIGNTRIDIWGGFQQYVRMASQLISGKYVSSTTGKEITLGEGYKSLTRFDIALRQVESKEAPVLSFITDLLRQKDYAGKPINIPNEVISRFIPMVLGDLYDIAKSKPELLPAGLLGVFGVGLQTYQPQKFGSGGKGFGNLKAPLKQSKGGLKGLKGVGL
jgi:hypothetical protein